MSFSRSGPVYSMPAYTTLIVEDFAPFRRYALLTLQQRADFQAVYQAEDGLEGVRRAQELRPDLILLDIGLPDLNGIEAARRIRKISPGSKIIFLTQESSAEIVQEAFNLGAQGYLLKSDMDRELLLAIDAILQGKQFVSSGLRPNAGNSKVGDADLTTNRFRSEERELHRQEREIGSVHVVASYHDDASFVDDFARFIEAALKMRNPVIVIATESHRKTLLQRLRASGWDIDTAIQRGSYVSLDAGDTLSKFMVNDWPDAGRLLKLVDDLIKEATKAVQGTYSKVAVCGECAPTLWAQGKAEAALAVEHLWEEIARSYNVDILCGYLTGDFPSRENSPIFQKICAVHSAAYSL